MVPGASVMFLVVGSFLGGVTTGSLSFLRLLYGTKRRIGPVCPNHREDRDGENQDKSHKSSNDFKIIRCRKKNNP